MSKTPYKVYVDDARFAALGVERVGLEDLASRADYVSVHTLLNAETRHLIGESFFSRMKPTALLINTSRGPVVDEPALTRALAAGKLFGAGLDVFDREPIAPDNPLPSLPNVLTAPHMAGVTKESFDRMATAVANNLLEALDGKPNPDNVVNKEVLGHR
jgi:D-3-phosphoglycerate dehydrogenase